MAIKVCLTHHAKRRFKKRAGLPPRAAEKAATDALRHGLRVRDLPSVLQPALRDMLARHNPGGRAFIRVHKGCGYVFCPREENPKEIVLITVLPALHLPEGK